MQKRRRCQIEFPAAISLARMLLHEAFQLGLKTANRPACAGRHEQPVHEPVGLLRVDLLPHGELAAPAFRDELLFGLHDGEAGGLCGEIEAAVLFQSLDHAVVTAHLSPDLFLNVEARPDANRAFVEPLLLVEFRQPLQLLVRLDEERPDLLRLRVQPHGFGHCSHNVPLVVGSE